MIKSEAEGFHDAKPQFVRFLFAYSEPPHLSAAFKSGIRDKTAHVVRDYFCC